MRVIAWYIVFLFLCTFWNSNLYLYLYRRSENLECEMTDEGHSLTFSPHFPPRRFNLAQNLSILKKKDFFFMQFWFSNLIGVAYSYISQLTAHHFDPLLNFLMLESIFLPLTVNLSFLFKLWDWNQLHIDSRVIRYHWPTLNKQSLIIFIQKNMHNNSRSEFQNFEEQTSETVCLALKDHCFASLCALKKWGTDQIVGFQNSKKFFNCSFTKKWIIYVICL